MVVMVAAKVVNAMKMVSMAPNKPDRGGLVMGVVSPTYSVGGSIEMK
jgi:hypothetical protein